MLLEMASLEGRGSLSVATPGTGEAKTKWTQPQCKLHGEGHLRHRCTG